MTPVAAVLDSSGNGKIPSGIREPPATRHEIPVCRTKLLAALNVSMSLRNDEISSRCGNPDVQRADGHVARAALRRRRLLIDHDRADRKEDRLIHVAGDRDRLTVDHEVR